MSGTRFFSESTECVIILFLDKYAYSILRWFTSYENKKTITKPPNFFLVDSKFIPIKNFLTIVDFHRIKNNSLKKNQRSLFLTEFEIDQKAYCKGFRDMFFVIQNCICIFVFTCLLSLLLLLLIRNRIGISIAKSHVIKLI